MAKFINTSATTYYLEEIIKNASDRLILISPYLRLNDRIKELLEDKNRLKIDVRIVYGKTDLRPDEADWLKGLEFVRTSFCKNLHAKCYMSEAGCIITSLNLYEFSQVNNNEMGVYIDRDTDPELYKETYDEALRIIRISEEVKIAYDRVPQSENAADQKTYLNDSAVLSDEENADGESSNNSFLTTSKLGSKHKKSSVHVIELLTAKGFLEDRSGKPYLTAKGVAVGASWRPGKFGGYFLWPNNILED